MWILGQPGGLNSKCLFLAEPTSGAVLCSEPRILLYLGSLSRKEKQQRYTYSYLQTKTLNFDTSEPRPLEPGVLAYRCT